MSSYSRERPASQGPQVVQVRLASYNVLAAFQSMESARRGIEALGRAGFDGQKTTLHGPAPDIAADGLEVAGADAKAMARITQFVVICAAMGGIAGFMFGVPLGALFIDRALHDDVGFRNTLNVAALLALGLGITSGLIAMMWEMQAADAWELTFHERYTGAAIVGLHTQDATEASRALDVLRSARAIDVSVMGSGGLVQDAAYHLAART
jgi:hypothetical protein